jgi:fatty-acyl-CoA synthase
MTELSPSGTVSPIYAPKRSGNCPSAGRRHRPAAHRCRRAGLAAAARRGGSPARARRTITDFNDVDRPGRRWLVSTGDLARIDAADNLIITGRAKDLIKSGGEWITRGDRGSC